MLYGSVGRVGLRALLGSVAFTPLSLFAAGEQGVWYDNSDFTTLFQDAAGTTPVTGYEQFVGLRLDKSKAGVGTNGAKRVNLLTHTEQFDNAAWNREGVPVPTANQTTAPDGTNTADLLVAEGVSVNHYLNRGNVSVVSGVTYTFSICLKKGPGAAAPDWVQLLLNLAGFGTQIAAFNISTGVAGNKTAGITSSSITAAGNGFWRCSIVATATGTSTASGAGVAFCNNQDTSSIQSYTAATGENVYIWGADLRLASEAATLPTYQRITDTWYNTIPGNHAFQSTTTARPVLSARKNLLVNTATLSTQNVTVRAVQHVLSFWGTGTITLSGVSTAGPLIGTSIDNRVYIAFTPTAGTLTLTVSGTVSRAQLEEANEGA